MWNNIYFKIILLTFEIVSDTPLIEIDAFSNKNLLIFYSKILNLLSMFYQ